VPQVGLGNQSAAIRIILWHVSRCRWLRRRRQCCQYARGAPMTPAALVALARHAEEWAARLRYGAGIAEGRVVTVLALAPGAAQDAREGVGAVVLWVRDYHHRKAGLHDA
jgi:hypothetical protein